MCHLAFCEEKMSGATRTHRRIGVCGASTPAHQLLTTKRSGDALELGIQTGADGRDRANDHHGNQCGDQTVFHCGHTAFAQTKCQPGACIVEHCLLSSVIRVSVLLTVSCSQMFYTLFG